MRSGKFRNKKNDTKRSLCLLDVHSSFMWIHTYVNCRTRSNWSQFNRWFIFQIRFVSLHSSVKLLFSFINYSTYYERCHCVWLVLLRFLLRIWTLFWLIFGIRPRWIYAKRFYANIKHEHWIFVYAKMLFHSSVSVYFWQSADRKCGSRAKCASMKLCIVHHHWVLNFEC